MLPRCRLAINAGRSSRGLAPLSDAQVRNIDERMGATMRRLAVRDPQAWRALTPDMRLITAAQEAMQDIAAEAQRKVDNAARQVLKTAETEQRVTTLMGRFGWGRARGLVEDMGRSHAYIDGIKRDNLRQLMTLIEAAGDRRGAGMGRQVLMTLFDAQNPAMTRDLALEVFAKGQANTGNALAKTAAEAWLEVTEAMRQRFNASGGDVGKLDYGYLPQSHDQIKVLAAGQDGWAMGVLQWVDRNRYLRDDGTRMDDGEVLDVLQGMWETISSDGANKRDPGAFRGEGARANRGSQSRELHFKDGEAYLAYLRQFGAGSMYDAMIGHVGGLSRDIGLVERYGPNPESQMRLQFDLYERHDGTRGVAGQVAENFAGPEAQWRVLSGASGTAAYARIASWGQHARNIETFGKLQGALLSSVTDLGTYMATVGYNKLGYWEAIKSIGAAATKDTRDFMSMHGLMAESMISDLNRWAGENTAQSWSGRVANSTMRLSLLNYWTDTLRRAFSLAMMGGTGRLVRTDWAGLSEWDRFRMEAKGITQSDWDVIRAAQPVQHRGVDIITPDAIYATQHPDAAAVVAKYIGLISDEAETAVLNPDLTTRAIVTAGGSQRGTAGGEFARAVGQFKAFPISMITRHWRRMIDTPQGLEGAPMMANRLAYGGALMVSLTALGAVAFQAKQIVSGKDPADMTTAKFWTRAFAQGGGLGFVGDMLLTDTTDDRSPMDTFGRQFMGPLYGSAADLYQLTKGNVDQKLAGKDAHVGAETVRFLRGHAPLVNLWYAKAALDHAGLFALQENMSPGYLDRIRNKARKDWHQEYWWNPHDPLPARGPSFEEMAGH